MELNKIPQKTIADIAKEVNSGGQTLEDTIEKIDTIQVPDMPKVSGPTIFERVWYYWNKWRLGEVLTIILENTIVGKVVKITNVYTQKGVSTVMGNWKTTIFGAGGLLVTIVTAVSLLLDGDPLTNPDWNLVAIAVTTAIGLLFAKDVDKTPPTNPS